jgi:hypothetical protein
MTGRDLVAQGRLAIVRDRQKLPLAGTFMAEMESSFCSRNLVAQEQSEETANGWLGGAGCIA